MKTWRLPRFPRFGSPCGPVPRSLLLPVQTGQPALVWLVGALSIVLICASVVMPPPLRAQSLAPLTDVGEYAAGEILVGWGPLGKQVTVPQIAGGRRAVGGQPLAAGLEAQSQLRVLAAYPEMGLFRLQVAPGQELAEASRVAKLPGVRYAEPNYTVYFMQDPAPASSLGDPTGEPFYDQQWDLPQIQAAAAWSMTTGRRSVIVAVLDTGIDYAHPEFAGRIVAGNDYVQYDDWPADDNGHGTFVASVIAAAANGQGMTGVAPRVSLMPLKVLNSDGYGYTSNSAAAIHWAVDHGANIINMSLGGPSDSSAVREAVTYAAQHNVLLVASAGNCATSGAAPICFGRINSNIYPAAYPDALAVGATDRDDRWGGYSNYGPWIDLVAPGGMPDDLLVGAWLNGGYYYRYGTSISAPLVVGAGALVLSVAPGTSRDTLLELLTGTTDKVDVYPYVDGRNDYLGYGRLNAGRALSEVPCAGCRGFVEGRLWIDEDGDGVFRAGEFAVAGHQVCAEPLAHRAAICVNSSADGNYRIGLPPGEYLVTSDPASPDGRPGQWSFSLPVTVAPGATIDGVDLGFLPAQGTPPVGPLRKLETGQAVRHMPVVGGAP